MLQSLFRPVLRPIMMGVMAVTGSRRAWSPLALWPNGAASPGMWIDPSLLTASFNDYLGTTPVATPGSVADSANPVGLALDIRAGATTVSDPGNHMLQATAAARPLESARVNLLTYTEDFGNAAWTPVEITITNNATTAPTGASTADLAVPTAVSENHRVRQNSTTAVAGAGASSFYVKDAGYSKIGIREDQATGALAAFDLSSGGSVIATHGAEVSNPTIVAVGSDWYRISATFSGVNPTRVALCVLPPSYTSGAAPSWSADGVSGVYIWGAQLELGAVATPYQSVPGDGSTYATDFPIFQKYDGVDDGMATASFAAGTLINGMDCMIPVRRDSAASAPLGICGDTGGGKFTGFTSLGDYPANNECGSPTVWVNNVQVSGGTNVRQDILNAAVPVGEFCIFELRNLDLSGWTRVFYGYGLGVPAYILNGARGDIMLFPSTDSTADKDAARQYLADKYGVTLP